MIKTLVAAVLMLSGIYLTCKLKFYSPIKLIRAMVLPFKKKSVEVSSKSKISPMSGLMTALAGSIGTGNIIGVAGAISIGGYGAIFWMWVSAYLSFSLKYSEIYLAVKYKQNGMGSPMLYIENGIGKKFKPLALVFAIMCLIASLGVGSAVQSNAAAEGLVAMLNGKNADIIRLVSGIIIATATVYAISGGAKRISEVASRLVPIMGLGYAILAIGVIVCGERSVFSALNLIITDAFSIKSVSGGIVGFLTCMTTGISYSLFSHEAGMGSSPMAHAASDENNPKRQAGLGIWEIIADTMIICTLTALAIICALPEGIGNREVTDIVIQAFGSLIGENAASIFLCISIVLFAFSSMISWSYYGLCAFRYLPINLSEKFYIYTYGIAAIAGACIPLNAIWSFATAMNMLMALPNVIAILIILKRTDIN